ncbi:type II toxin-antitoxin system VapC family toxin [Streptomyces sp. NPDC051940]|uniref:type II toxin-antitoxin system VapC family toxin n=1 Tax=Streptomyces sp. NPDC051940 TaxID=3155675 RepID=UPI00341BF431
MIFCDVNVLVYAFRKESGDHARYHEWLGSTLSGDEPVAVNSVVTSGFLRIVTNPRIFTDPAPVGAALEFVTALREAPAAVPLREGPRHWEIFERLCRKTGARGNVIPDAYFAALAIEAGATLCSADRGFARFPGLRWRHPLEDEAG